LSFSTAHTYPQGNALSEWGEKREGEIKLEESILVSNREQAQKGSRPTSVREKGGSKKKPKRGRGREINFRRTSVKIRGSDQWKKKRGLEKCGGADSTRHQFD